MIALETLSTFIVTSAILGLTPGPDNIFVLTQSIVRGRVAGIVVTLGLCTGILVHTTAVAFGISTIFQTSEYTFNILKYLGAVYLLYLAYQAFRSSSTSLDRSDAAVIMKSKLYQRGIIMNVTNPKVSIFFLAFLPQFTDPSQGNLLGQIFLLGLLFIIITCIVFGAVALLAGNLGRWLRTHDNAQLILNRIAGVVFILLAVKLVTTSA